MASTKEIEIDTVRRGGCSVVHVCGDINWKTSPELRAVILDLIERRSQERVIVDLAGTSRLDSSGISSFIEALVSAKKRKARFILSGLSESSRRVLALTRLSSLFETTDTVEQALP